MTTALNRLDHEISETRRHLAALLELRDELAAPTRYEPQIGAAGLLRQACIDLAIPIGVDDTVSEADAARLLGRSKLTLRNRRLTDNPIPFVRSGSRVMYRLSDLARIVDE
ncbi:hypothetical protein [Ensifer sp. BR816]|uniref:hypothetical protein n=1 Tax=Rhizobium sp. (strain BR816) TaxID=1057002 RepID=UPI00036B9F7B|nr:hypothetical protein [Ensifer sp. BR816]